MPSQMVIKYMEKNKTGSGGLGHNGKSFSLQVEGRISTMALGKGFFGQRRVSKNERG